MGFAVKTWCNNKYSQRMVRLTLGNMDFFVQDWQGLVWCCQCCHYLRQRCPSRRDWAYNNFLIPLLTLQANSLSEMLGMLVVTAMGRPVSYADESITNKLCSYISFSSRQITEKSILDIVSWLSWSSARPWRSLRRGLNRASRTLYFFYFFYCD